MAISAGELRRALAAKFAEPEWAFMQEVRNSTGHVHGARYADAIALNLYPSRGLPLIGFEIKVSRADWKAELKNPDKSAAIQKYCDEWWVVAPVGIVPKDDLPRTWGLMEYEADGQKLKSTVKAPKLKPAPLDREFIAAVMRKEAGARKVQPQEINDAYQNGFAMGAAQEKSRAESLAKNFEELKARLADFQRISGIDISKWGYRDVAASLRILMRDDLQLMKTSLEVSIDRMESALSSAKTSLQSWPERPVYEDQG